MTRKIIAYVTRLGYLYCARCSAQRDFFDGSAQAVEEHSYPHCEEFCDACQQPLQQSQPVYTA